VPNKVLIVGFEDRFAFFIWQNLFAVPEKNVQFVEKMGRSLNVD
jgi:hypothetical protein